MSVLDTADTIRARYEGAAPQLDPEGFRLFRAAGEITGIRNLWEEFPYDKDSYKVNRKKKKQREAER